MINIETIKFVKMLDNLAALSTHGIERFSAATSQRWDTQIFFDDTQPDEDGNYPVVLDACLVDDPACPHHDIVCYYDNPTTEYTVRVLIENGEEPFIIVSMRRSDEQISICNGQWSFV